MKKLILFALLTGCGKQAMPPTPITADNFLPRDAYLPEWRYITTHDCHLTFRVPPSRRWSRITDQPEYYGELRDYVCPGIEGWILVVGKL